MGDEQTAWTSFALLERYRNGDDRAADDLFARYFARLVALARSRLAARLARRTDPEDIVLSAYRSFFVGTRAGRYTLSRGGDLWRLLAATTRHKVLRQVRHQTADRRSVTREVPLDGIDEGLLAGRSPIPEAELAAELLDELEWVLARLDPCGRRVLELRLQGHQLAEIAQATGRAERTVRRSLAQARALLAGRLGMELDRAATETPVAAPVVDAAWLSDRDFLLHRLIGAGGMGKVYEATRRDDGGKVAVKFLRKPLLAHLSVVRRFVGEARTVAGLDHPNIVGTAGLGRTAGGSYFLVMDLVAGPNLDRITRERAITPGEAIGWVRQVALALEHAHERGVIHCDLKPANLLLDQTGLIRITDFGLARSLTAATPWAAEVEGTAPFMAPEQASPAWGSIDGRTDVYGVGAVLFTLLTGRPPIVGGTRLDLLAQVASATPVVSPASLRPDLPGPLADLCRKCLAKAPEDRFASARDLRLALEGLL